MLHLSALHRRCPDVLQEASCLGDVNSNIRKWSRSHNPPTHLPKSHENSGVWMGSSRHWVYSAGHVWLRFHGHSSPNKPKVSLAGRRIFHEVVL